MNAKNLMNAKDLEGKDIIDSDGENVGTVDSLQVNIINKTVTGIVAKEKSISAKLGLGESSIIPIENIQALGESVVLKK